MKQTKTILNCDTLVAGGGIAGIAAALASARTGAKTLLVEKECVLGGLGTLGLVTIYLPLCDGKGTQVIYGIGEELLRLSIRRGCQGKYPAAWLGSGTLEEKCRDRFQAQYNPHLFAFDVEKLLLDAGVSILYDTRITGTEEQDGFIRQVQAYNKGGETVIFPKMLVDATGDADLCRMSGAPAAIHQGGNPLAAWYYFCGKDGLRLKMLGAADIPGQETESLTKRRYSGLDGQENSEMIVHSHQQILADVLHAREDDPALEPVTIPGILQIRMTSRLDGAYTLDEGEDHVSFPDSVGMTGDWRKRGPVFEIPYGCLQNAPKAKNLQTPGRCISVTDDMWDITRVIPTCAVTGEAAGTAAALAAALDVPDLNLLPVNRIQKALREGGVRLHLDEIR